MYGFGWLFPIWFQFQLSLSSAQLHIIQLQCTSSIYKFRVLHSPDFEFHHDREPIPVWMVVFSTPFCLRWPYPYSNPSFYRVLYCTVLHWLSFRSTSIYNRLENAVRIIVSMSNSARIRIQASTPLDIDCLAKHRPSNPSSKLRAVHWSFFEYHRELDAIQFRFEWSCRGSFWLNIECPNPTIIYSKTNERQCNTIWDECVYVKNPIPVRMIVSTPSDSIPLRIHIHGQGVARPYRKKDNQPSTYLFPSNTNLYLRQAWKTWWPDGT
jgi:hypothetical protein